MSVFVPRSAAHTLLGVLAAAILAITNPAVPAAQDPASPPQRWDGLIERLSTPGEWAAETWVNPRMSRHATSADGRLFVFAAETPNPPYSPSVNIVVRNRQSNETQQWGTDVAEPPVVSSDGNHLAFVTCGPWWRPDYQPICDVWGTDLRTNRIENLSSTPDGTWSSDHSAEPVLSASGRFVVFRTASPTLLPAGAVPGQLVLRDRDTDGNGVFDEPGTSAIHVVSVSTTGEPGNAESATPEVSADGRFVAFRSRASNLVAGDTNGAWDVFLRDLQTGETRRINTGWDGQEATPTLDSPAISMSEDGRFLAFAADDWYLTNPPAPVFDENDAMDVYVYDAVAGTLTRLDLGAGGVPGNGATDWPSLSADGRYVAVTSLATNVADPGMPGRTHVFVHDRATGQTTRVSTKPDGTEPDRDSANPTISSDGSLVTFTSQATNLPTAAPPDTDTIYAAVHFAATPSSIVFPAAGGRVTVTVTAQQYVSWDPRDVSFDWLQFASGPFGMGNGSFELEAQRNYDPDERTDSFNLRDRTITATQAAGTWITSIDPAQGPATGGTVVTLSGTSFEPGMRLFFDGIEVPVEYVSASEVRAVTPPHAAGAVWFYMATSDWTYVPGIQDGFRYTDVTPPDIFSWVDGTQGPDGWYTSDVQVSFSYWDPESEIVTADGCFNGWVRTDTPGTTYTCTVTSEGGTAARSVTIKVDRTGPAIDVQTPATGLYPADAPPLSAAYTCADSLTGVTECTGTVPNGEAVEASPGLHIFDLHAIDGVGNMNHAEVRYAVASGTCAPRPRGVVAWFPFEGPPGSAASYMDRASGIQVTRIGTPAIVPGMVGEYALSNPGAGSYLMAGTREAFARTGAFTLMAWVKPGADTAEPQAIAGREGEYMLARFPDGTLRYAVATPDGQFAFASTWTQLPRDTWTHVVLRSEGPGGLTEVFVNGWIVVGRREAGPVVDARPDLNEFRIAAREEPGSPWYFTGEIDDVFFANRALGNGEYLPMYLAGADGICEPLNTTLTLAPDPLTIAYGTTQEIELVATFRSDDGSEPDQTITFLDPAGTPIGTAQTGSDFTARLVTTVSGTAAGTRPGYQARFAGDFRLRPAAATAQLTVTKATPTIEISSPPKWYIARPQQATVTVRGLDGVELYPYTVLYDGSATLPVNAGTYAVHVTFAGNDNYAPASADGTFVINKQTPFIGFEGTTITYDGQPHGLGANVSGYQNEPLTPVTVTYNGSTEPPTSAGVYTAVAQYDGSTNYTPISKTVALTILKAAPYINWVTSSSITYGTPLGAAQLNATATLPGTFTYTPAAGTILPVGTHVVEALFTPSDSVNYATATRTSLVYVSKAYPSVTWPAPADITYGTALGDAQLNATANVPGTFVYSPAAGTILNAGALALHATFTPDDTANYHGKNAATLLRVNPAPTTVSWAPPAPITYGTALGVTQLNATASVGGTFSYAPGAGTILGAGTHELSVTFTPADANYAPSTSTVSLTVTRATPAITWPSPAGIVYGTALGATQLNATAQVSGTFVYDPAAGTILGAGSQVLSVTFTPYDSANYSPATTTVLLDVAKAPTVISWPKPQSITYGNALGFYELRASASVPGTLVYTPPFGTILDPGEDQVLSVAFTPEDGANYEPSAATTTITVVRAGAPIFWTPPAAITYGTPLSDAQLNATSTIAGTFTYSPAAGTVLDAGSQSLSVTFTPSDTFRYTPASMNMGLTVHRRAPVFAWPQPDAIAYGTPLGPAHLNATADVPGTFTYTPGLSSVLEPGVHTLVAAFRPDDTNNYYTYAEAVTTTLTVNKAVPQIAWPAPASMVYGTPLGGSQFNATAHVAGTFAYTPAAGTVLGAGTHVLAVTFTPAEPNRYATATATINVTVVPAPLTVRANDAVKPFGAPLPLLTATIAGLVNGDTTAALSGAPQLATTATQWSAVGTYPITISGVSSPNYAVTFVNGTLTVARGQVAVALATSPEPSGLDQPIALTVSVSAATPAAGAPSGVVSFFDGATLLGHAAINGGIATLSTAGLDSGTRALQARYQGDGSFEPGTAGVSHVVLGAAETPAIAITSTRNPSNVGQSVTFAADVSRPSGPVTGTIEFYDGATLIGSAPILSGRAVMSTAALAAGSHAISARYAGAATAPPVKSGVLVQAVGASGWKDRASSIAVTASPAPALLGDTVTITANVTGSSSAMPGGQVLVIVDGNVLAPATLTPLSGATARVTVSLAGLAHGRHTVSATYLGDPTYKGSTAQVIVVVN